MEGLVTEAVKDVDADEPCLDIQVTAGSVNDVVAPLRRRHRAENRRAEDHGRHPAAVARAVGPLEHPRGGRPVRLDEDGARLGISQDADTGDLGQIAAATGGQNYLVNNPDEVLGVLAAALLNRCPVAS